MNSNGEQNQGFRFPDRQQQRIYENLRLVGPGAQAFFLDACKTMASPEPPASASNIIGHLLRETESALRDVLEPLATRMDARTTDSEHRQEIEGILKALGIPLEHPTASAWLEIADRNKKPLPQLAHRQSLKAPRTLGGEVAELWKTMLSIFDDVLARFRDRFLSVFDALDGLLAKDEPTAADVDFLTNHVPCNAAAHGHFFTKCDNPKWLPLLRVKRFFENPPGPVEDPETGSVRFPTWPQSDYLARMAVYQPAEILDIIISLDPPSPWVRNDLAKAVLAMPPEIAVRAVPAMLRWLGAPYQLLLLPKNACELVAKLAEASELDGAFALAEEFLDLTSPREPASGFRHDHYHYRELVQSVLPTLTRVAPKRLLGLLLSTFDHTLESSAATSHYHKPNDWSHTWRPAIEDDEQNWQHDCADVLVTAIREALVQIVASDPTQMAHLVQVSEEKEWIVYQRLALYLLSKFPEAAPTLVAERLGNRVLFDNYQVQHEYALLAKAGFPVLDPHLQDAIMGWVESRPSDEEVESHVKAWEQYTGRRPSEDDVRRYKRYWQATRLAWFKGSLPQKWQAMYERLVAELGDEPEHPDFATYHSTRWVGHQSPKSAEELRSMDWEELLDFLATWEPPQEPRRLGREQPDRGGLGRELSRAVAAEPGHFLPVTQSLTERSPLYVPSLLSGLLDAVRQDRSLDWGPVLELCKWVIEEQPAADVVDGTFQERFPNWEWTRSTIADLVEAGLRKDRSDIPHELRRQVWDVILPLTEDPEPTPEYEAEYGGENMKPLQLSINTTRGKALHAVVRYALWVRKHIDGGADSAKRLARGFGEMSEVRTVLDQHLDPEQDPSLAVRAVYGQWFPWLWLLDKEWAVQRLGNIFPPHEQERDRWEAAWHTYVVYDQPFNDILRILRGEYARAIERVDTTADKSGELHNPDVRLGDHLLTYYCRGFLPRDDLLDRFFEQAPGTTSGTAMANLGHGFATVEGGVAEDVIACVRELVDWRVEAAANGETGTEPEELKEYGWFFAAEAFESDWALSMLARVITLAGKVEPDHMIYERLAALVEKRPAEVMECLSRMVEVEKEGWGLLGSKEEIRSILQSAMTCGDQRARETAMVVINRLGERGYLEYRDLLPPRSDNGQEMDRQE